LLQYNICWLRRYAIEYHASDSLLLSTFVPAAVVELRLVNENMIDKAILDVGLLAVRIVIQRLAIVHVDIAGSCRFSAWEDLEGDRIAESVQETHLVSVLQDRDDRTLAYEDTLLAVGKSQLLQACARNDHTIVPVVPSGGLGQSAVDVPFFLSPISGWLFKLRAHENVFTKHKLRFKTNERSIVRELEPHGTKKRFGFARSLVEHGVDVMDKVIAHVDGIVDHSLNTIVLEPWLPILEVDLVVSPKEGIEHAKLVHHDPEIFGWLQLVAWNVSTTEGMACNTDREHFVERAPRLAHKSLSITCPHRPILLTAEEVGTG